MPLTLPAVPLPARETTAPTGLIFSRRWLPHAPTYAFPSASAGEPCGPPNAAEAPTPEKNAALPFPASVDTCPKGVITRTRLAAKSPTYTRSDTGSTATPWG
jgi:hypothetical protein